MGNEDSTPSLEHGEVSNNTGEVSNTGETSGTGLNAALNTASGQAQSFLDQVNAVQVNLESELRSARSRINILERYLEACRERPLLGPEDSPEALGGDVTILPDGTVYDTKTGIAISPNN